MNFIHEQFSLGYDDLHVEGTSKGRFYVTPEGNRYPSVTTVLGAGSDMSWKDKWIARVGEEEARKVSIQASGRGTAVHEIIEKYLRNDPNYTKNHMPANIYSFKNVQMKLDENLGTIYALESPLYSDRLCIAGRVDCVAEWAGLKSIIDFKTSKRNKTHDSIHNYFLQASMYAFMFFERTGIAIPQIVVLITTDEDGGQVFVEKSKNWLPKAFEIRESVSHLYPIN